MIRSVGCYVVDTIKLQRMKSTISSGNLALVQIRSTSADRDLESYTQPSFDLTAERQAICGLEGGKSAGHVVHHNSALAEGLGLMISSGTF